MGILVVGLIGTLVGKEVISYSNGAVCEEVGDEVSDKKFY